jgi:tyrosinase
MSLPGGLWLVLLLLPILKVCGHGVAYDYGFEVDKVLKRHEINMLITQIGARSAGTLPLRQDVRQLEQDPYAWNIYILALSMMQFTSQDNLLSWYSACGTFNYALASAARPCVQY